MKIIKEESVKIFGQDTIVQLVEIEQDVTMNTYPYDGSKGRKMTKFYRLRFKNKFNPEGEL